MKKYVKPELFYEHYELSQEIAACRYDLNFEDKDTCTGNGYISPDFPDTIVIGLIGVDGCQSEVDDYCYTPGTGGANTFNS